MVRRRVLLMVCGLALAPAGAACDSSSAQTNPPSLAQRGTTLTTVKPSRQDISNSISLSGKVTMDPVYGLVAPVAGQVRFVDVPVPKSTPTKPTRVATVVAGGKSHDVSVPAGSVFSGRLVDDRSSVTVGMPIVSARYVGYGIEADIDGAQAYKISDALGSVQAQIKNGPGPFPCTVLGTIAALPAGTVPQPTAQPSTQPTGGSKGLPLPGAGGTQPQSDPTGMRLVCTAPPDVRLINGATATVNLITDRASNALVLPVEAVAGGQGKGKVDVVKPDGTRETRDVVLGLTDGRMIEIKSGLTGDETIAVPGPNLPTPPAGNSNPNGKPGLGVPVQGPT